MNDISPNRFGLRTTQAAEGVPRYWWTTAELLRLAGMGAFDHDKPFELIGGEIVPISPQGRPHEVIREDLERCLRKRETDEVHVIAEPQLNFADDSYTIPDILVKPSSLRSPDVRGDTALLVIEIADSSYPFDASAKAKLYALHGVREVWVINARTLTTRVHRQPTASGYGEVTERAASDTLVPLLVPSLAVRLADLDLE